MQRIQRWWRRRPVTMNIVIRVQWGALVARALLSTPCQTRVLQRTLEHHTNELRELMIDLRMLHDAIARTWRAVQEAQTNLEDHRRALALTLALQFRREPRGSWV